MTEDWLLNQGKTFLLAIRDITGTNVKTLIRLADYVVHNHHLSSDFYNDTVVME